MSEQDMERAIDVVARGYGISHDALQSAILYAAGYGDDTRLVQIGAVQPFDEVPSPHDTVRKLVEESAEVFGAWEIYSTATLNDAKVESRRAYNDLAAEVGDVIQCVANLLAGLGVCDARDIVMACRRRNVERGRIKPSQR